MITVSQTIEDKLTKKFLKNKTFKDEKTARSTAALFTAAFEKLSETTGISVDELIKREMPYIVNENKTTDKNAYNQADKTITPIHIDTNSVPNFESISDLKKWIQNNLNLLGEVEIKSNGRIVQFSKSNIARSMKGINRNQAKRNSYSGLKKLVENAQYSYVKDVDSRHSQRNKGQEIYHNAFNYNGKTYGIEISIDIPISEKSKHSYAGHKIKVLGITEVSSKEGLLDSTSTTISINDIRTLFNHNVTKDNTLSQNGNSKKGSFTPDENVIKLFKTADESTIVHEFSHWYLDKLVKYSYANPELKQDIEEVRKFVENNGGEFTIEQHEKFARGFEAYIRNGNSKNGRLQKIFEDFKNALLHIYKSIKEIVYSKNAKEYSFTKDDISRLENLFDRLFTTQYERVNSNTTELQKKLQAISPNTQNKITEKTAQKPNVLYQTEAKTQNKSQIQAVAPNTFKKQADKNIKQQKSSNFNIDDVDEILEKVKKPKDNILERSFTPISSRLGDINPHLKHAIRKFEFDSALAENKSAAIVKPFIDKLSKMPESDYAKYDLALKNGMKDVIDTYNKKYGLTKEYLNIKDLLRNLRDEALNYGMEVGEIEDYFPRKVINPSQLMLTIPLSKKEVLCLWIKNLINIIKIANMLLLITLQI